MRAKDVMTPNVVTVAVQTPVVEIARTLVKWRISAVPVLDDHDRLVGIVSEGDLVRHEDAGGDRSPAWWLTHLADPDSQVAYVKAHGHVAGDVMSKHVVTVSEDAMLSEIAQLLEEHQIKRVPVMRRQNVVGIVSRANLLHGLAAATLSEGEEDEQQLRASILNRLRNEARLHLASVNVTVTGDTAHAWGTATSETQKLMVRAVVEGTPGVSHVVDHMTVLPTFFQKWLPGAEEDAHRSST
jgi:CBS domain-containing protein